MSEINDGPDSKGSSRVSPFVGAGDLPEDFEEQLVVAAARERFDMTSPGYYDGSSGLVQIALRNEARPYIRGVILWLEDRGFIPPQKVETVRADFTESNQIDLYSGKLGQRVKPVLKKISEATVAQSVGLPSSPSKILTDGNDDERSDSFTEEADGLWAERNATDRDYDSTRPSKEKLSQSVDREVVEKLPSDSLYDDSNERVDPDSGWVRIKRADLNELLNIAKVKDDAE